MAPRTWRTLLPGQRSRLVVFDPATGERAVVHESTTHVFEAPNWVVSPEWGEDAWLVFNQDGLIHRVPAEGSPGRSGRGGAEGPAGSVSPVPSGGAVPVLVPTGDVDASNNDHVVSPDGRWLYVSAEDGHIHRVSLAAGTSRRVTHEHDGPFRHYLHGISPDGRTLSYIGLEPRADGPGARTNVFTIGVDGDDTQLTFGDAPHDGAEFDPSGEWIYFNSERASVRPGHAQLFRCRPDGRDVEQLTFDDRVNWFPHVAPGGRDLVYVSFEPGVTGHPENEPVLIRRIDPAGVRADGGRDAEPTDLVAVFGGQGTMNVASWSPDGARFAYAEYPIDG